MEVLPDLLGLDPKFHALFWILFNVCYFSTGVCNGALVVYNYRSMMGPTSGDDPCPFVFLFIVFGLGWPVFLVPNVLATIILWARWAFGMPWEEPNVDD